MSSRGDGLNRQAHDGPRSDIGNKHPHHVDLVPPLAGFDESVEEEMIEFLEQHIGTFDLYGEIESVDAFVRYCFARAEDARTFHSRFAAAAHKAHLHAVS